MSRNKQKQKWLVNVNDRVVDVKSKTYRGACFKACKKLGIEVPVNTRYRDPESHKHTIKYIDRFDGIQAIKYY